MQTSAQRFTLTKNTTNEFYIIIKQDASTLPMEIMPEDTFVVKLFNLSDSSLVTTLDNSVKPDGSVTVYDAKNGKLKITFTESFVNNLRMERGDRADYYYSKPLYRLIIEAQTQNNGDFVATVDKVYVR